MLPAGHHFKGYTKRKGNTRSNLAGGGGAYGVFMESLCWLTMTMHQIRVAGHLGVRLPATPPPRALGDKELFVIECSQKLLCEMP